MSLAGLAILNDKQGNKWKPKRSDSPENTPKRLHPCTVLCGSFLFQQNDEKGTKNTPSWFIFWGLARDLYFGGIAGPWIPVDRYEVS
jgi:hypothetical protein